MTNIILENEDTILTGSKNNFSLSIDHGTTFLQNKVPLGPVEGRNLATLFPQYFKSSASITFYSVVLMPIFFLAHMGFVKFILFCLDACFLM